MTTTIATWIPLLTVFVTVFAGILTWSLTERSKRAADEYERKEMRYAGLIGAIRGFASDSQSKEMRLEFLNQLNLAWMYCPDNVISAAYAFLVIVAERATPGSENEHDRRGKDALGHLMLAIRQDLLTRALIRTTELRASDFRLLSPR